MEHMMSDSKKHGCGGGVSVIRGAFHILTNTLLSLLLPLSFLVLARLSTVNYFLSISDNQPTSFLNKTPTILLLVVSVISASALAQQLTGKITFSSNTRLHLYAAWIFLCVLQLCVGVGVEGSIATGIDGSSFGQARKGLLCRLVFFLGLHETTRFWWRTVVKPVVDDTVLGVYNRELEEGWLVKVVMGMGFGCLWWWRVREEVEALAELKGDLMMGIGLSDFVGCWLYYITLTIGMVGIVKGFIRLLLMFFICNNNHNHCKPTPNHENIV